MPNVGRPPSSSAHTYGEAYADAHGEGDIFFDPAVGPGSSLDFRQSSGVWDRSNTDGERPRA
jgi:hypothetical protein